MPAETHPADHDVRQVETLCHDLEARVETVQAEEQILTELEKSTAPVSRIRARQYALLVHRAKERANRLRATIMRYCQRK